HSRRPGGFGLGHRRTTRCGENSGPPPQHAPKPDEKTRHRSGGSGRPALIESRPPSGPPPRASAAAGPAPGEPRRTLAPRRDGSGRLGLLRGLPADPRMRRVRLLAVVSGPDEGPRPPVVQHGGVRPPGKGGGAP